LAIFSKLKQQQKVNILQSKKEKKGKQTAFKA